MTHEEILQLLYDETLVGNAPVNLAAVYGLAERGTLEVGKAADICVFDPDTVELESKKQVKDFPGGEARYSARPRGIYWTIVNGVPVVRDGEVLDANLPGHVVRPGVD